MWSFMEWASSTASQRASARVPGGFNPGPFLIFFSAAMWAGDSVFRPYVSVRMPSEAVVCWEHILGLVVLIPFSMRIFVHGCKVLDWRMYAGLTFCGIGADALANVLMTKGYSLGHIALVALLQESQPVWGLVLARVMLNESMGNIKITGPLAFGAIAGLFLMMWPFVRELHSGHLPSSSEGPSTFDGILSGICGLGAAVIWAAETVVARQLLCHSAVPLSSMELLIYRQLIGMAALILYCFVLTTRPLCTLLGLECWVVVYPNRTQTLFLSLMSFLDIFSHVIYFVALDMTPAGVAVIMELANPLLLLTVVPRLIHLVDPTYRLAPLEAEQWVGAAVVVMCTCALGLYEARREQDEEEGASSLAVPKAPSTVELLPMEGRPDIEAHELPRRGGSGGGSGPVSISPAAAASSSAAGVTTPTYRSRGASTPPVTAAPGSA
eukprot:RCo017582